MVKRALKSLSIIFLIVFLLLIFTFLNQQYVKGNLSNSENIYKNKFAEKIKNNDISDIDYYFILNDLNAVDDILKEQIDLDVDKNKKSRFYSVAESVYSQKLNEIIRILNEKLDDEDFHRLELDIDDFQKNIDFAITDISNMTDSSIDFEFYKNKYLYEEKQKKCREVLETYKGFLQ